MIPYIKGITSTQAHVAIPDGLVEEEYARNGFFGRYAHFYRTQAPVLWSAIEGPLKPRAYDTKELKGSKDFYLSRKNLLENTDVRVAFSKFDQPMDYFFRNADGDELFFIHKGGGEIETDFGPLQYRVGDYIVIPRGTLYRVTPSTFSEFLIVESFSEINFPDKGMLGQHALIDPASIIVPTPETTPRKSLKDSYEVRIKRADEITKVYYPFYPINTVGWKGTLAVWQLNVENIRPVSSDRYHLPPSTHTTFVAHNFVVCSFLPRPLENGDPKAMKVPFYHSNIDFDEVLFYHSGEFFSRTGIGEGMITLHPQGIQHGPQEGAVERSRNKTHTNEVAIMVDTKRPLKVSESAKSIEIEKYHLSWQEK